ncbi:MAG: ATP-binding protein, partial [Isosphaeraceae bacterium]
GQERRCIGVRLSLAHPFMDRFGGTDAASIEPLLRVAAAIGLAETAARDAGVLMAGTFRRNINELMRDALSRP